MKQHITIEQLKELTDEEIYTLNTLINNKWNLTKEEFENYKNYNWNKILEDIARYCTIGKIMEILKKNNFLSIYQVNKIPNNSDYGFKWVIELFHHIECPIDIYESDELVDALWKGLKDVIRQYKK